MEEAPENGKESSHSAYDDVMNEWIKCEIISCGDLETVTYPPVNIPREKSKS